MYVEGVKNAVNVCLVDARYWDSGRLAGRENPSSHEYEIFCDFSPELEKIGFHKGGASRGGG